jgi:molybdopterin/thiamine biosynthesis adenylyltransferase
MREDEARRYARHLLLPELDEAAHERLRAARVLVVGIGGLASPALYYLAAAGVGHLGLVDGDVVEASNLQRQILHFTPDIGRPKTDSAAEKLRALNPTIAVKTHATRLTAANALELIAGYDIVVTGVDNFPTRYLLNDAVVMTGKTLVEGAVLQFSGIAMTIRGGETACYRCLFPQAPPDGTVPGAAEAGVFGPAAGLIGVIQATEVLKVAAGFGRPLFNRALFIDLLEFSFDDIPVRRDPACPVCGTAPTITSLRDES